ncbi:MAG: hypothetical protein S4CHLAM6_02750 [Chlamydiae bacterium]|nr:hypothetical protein [Chlamydiota bacterium]
MPSSIPQTCSISRHEQGNRIYFSEDSRGLSSVSGSRSVGRSQGKIGIKKAGFFERILGKATKISFDGGRTTTWVNTNSLKKYIFDISSHETYFKHQRAIARGQAAPEHDIYLQKPKSSKTLKTAYNVFFKVFKSSALKDSSAPSQAPLKLGDHLVKFIRGSHQFKTDFSQDKQSEALKKKNYLEGEGFVFGVGSGDQLQKSASKAAYTAAYDWEKIHNFMIDFPVCQERISHFDEEARRQELTSRPVEVIEPMKRTDTGKYSTAKKLSKLTAAIGMGGAIAGPPGAVAGAALYGAGEAFYKAWQMYNAQK